MMAVQVRHMPGAVRLPRSYRRGDGVAKIEYRHRREARRAARLSRLTTPGMQAYSCRYGEHWHVGHRRRHAEGAAS
jgi:hypothetical protein